jgi:hypothetical protein
MIRSMVRSCLLLAVVAVAVGAGRAHATDDSVKAAARDLANEAKRDFDGGRFAEAEAKFARAFSVAKVPTLAVWTARAMAKRGRLVAACELYRQAIQLTPNDLWIGHAQQQAQADARRELPGLQPRIPRLRIILEHASPREVEVSVDDLAIAPALVGADMPTDPGRRTVAGRRAGELVEVTVELGEGERRDAILRFAEVGPPVDGGAKPELTDATAPPETAASTLVSPPASPGKPPVLKRWWFWTAVGAAVVTGTVAAFLLAHRPGVCSGADFTCGEVR